MGEQPCSFCFESLEPRVFLATHGLNATYFNNRDFTGTSFSRIDPRVYFDFGVHESPAPQIKGDTFSIRWSGMVYPAFSETYTFTVRCNDGVRLWVGGELVIDRWVSHPRENVSGTVALTAKRLYDLRLEYFDNRRTAAIRMSWSSPSTPKQLVPNSRLFPYQTRFAAIGDFGRGDEPAGDVAELIDRWKADFIVTVGDNNYPTGSAQTIDQNIGQFYHSYIGNYRGDFGQGSATNRFFPSLGNHDWDNGNVRPHIDYFTLPGNERYYEFVRGPVHFFVIDSDPREPDGVSPDSTQGRWLRNRLSQSNSLYNIVYFHHTPFSSGVHGNSTFMQWPFREWGADVILAGHDHHYERLKIDGLPYFVVGASASTRSIGNPIPGSIVRDNSDVGSLLIQASEKRITFQYQHRSGQVIDTLTLSPRPH